MQALHPHLTRMRFHVCVLSKVGGAYHASQVVTMPHTAAQHGVGYPAQIVGLEQVNIAAQIIHSHCVNDTSEDVRRCVPQ